MKKWQDSMNKLLNIYFQKSILGITGEKPTESDFNEMRKQCEILKEAKVYDFDTECDNIELLKQIHNFAGAGVKN